jgi:glycogen debranching enzyme
LEELIQYNNQYYILTTSSAADDHTSVLKQGETFGVFDRNGDIRAIGLGKQGLYHEGTRYVSCFRLRLAGTRPLLLSSNVRRDNASLTVDLTNPDFCCDGQAPTPRGSLHIARSILLWQATCYERLRIRNYGHYAARVPLSLEIGADFADIFEVRGTSRKQRGRQLAARTDRNSLLLEYEGLDAVMRQLRIEFTLEPAEMSDREAIFELWLEPDREETIVISARCCSWLRADLGQEVPLVASCPYEAAFALDAEANRAARSHYCEILTSNERFNDWLQRSESDLVMMITETGAGPFPDAGVPWFATRFGRDGIVTALETLWVNPEISAGVLRYLAERQALETNTERDAEPGKILHETRKGEMAALGEIPFGCYYGSIDSTPLFVMLAAAYYERTADLDLISRLWPSVRMALDWIDNYGDQDRDGFVEYYRMSPSGLVHQGWKDSWDAIFHADGTLAQGPIALCEVQGYVYAAKLAGAQILRALGQMEAAQKLEHQARALREQFERAFWCEEMSSYALALDGEKRPCRVRTSNAGYALFTGIAGDEHARRTGGTLMNADSFSGWGIRTVARCERPFNPMSYHNGSVWPHDNALIASGFARYGLRPGLMQVFTGLFYASTFVKAHGLPELFCGFERRPGEGPTFYPVACSPQSWASASVFSLLQSALGLSIAAPQHQVRFTHPRLPPFLKEVEIRNLRIGQSAVDLSLRRHDDDSVSFNVRKKGQIDIITTK